MTFIKLIVLNLAASCSLLYEAGQFEEAAQSWQQAESSFAALGDKLNQAMALSNLSLTVQQL